ncbi:MAG: argininosuccinate lyase [Gammaproteobacteria bacterium]|jgi:argininosuccinate lyase
MSQDNSNAKLWGGRFQASTDQLVEAFSASVQYDKRLYLHDILGSIAHATMLAKVEVLTDAERDAITSGLQAIRTDIEADKFHWDPALEDVHMNIEAALTKRIGEAGKKLHTGRSRNDQVATDVRLYLRDAIDDLCVRLTALMSAIIDLAEQETHTIMPGFTHLQTAQPVTFGHHLLAWQEMLSRDRERFADCRKRVNRMPLGAAALAGTSYPIDRELTAQLLGFDTPCSNSLDAVSDRDFMIEFTAACSLVMVHLSRMSEELVLWSSAQFSFVTLSDAYCTGSSIMPQKKNPDVPELVRGKCGRVIGSLNALLVLMKGQPLAYNRDNQEDKEPLFDALDTVLDCVSVYTGLIGAITPNRDAMRDAALKGHATATDLADYLVRKGVAFRDAHEIVGKAVHEAVQRGCELSDLSLVDLNAFSDAISDDVFQVLTLEGSVNARDHIGGTAPAQVIAAAARARTAL